MILLFYAFLGALLQQTGGHYDPGAVLWLGGAGIGLSVWVAVRGALIKSGSARPRFETPLALLAIVVAGFALLDLYWPGLAYPTSAERLNWLRAGLGLLFVAALCAAGASILNQPRWLAIAFGAALLLAMAVRVLTLYVSPQPYIDVFNLTSQAANYVLAGQNPYRQHYVDIYNGLYGYGPGANYPPVYYYWSALFRVLGDIRWGSVAGDALAAAGLWGLGRRLGLPVRYAALFILAWLLFPTALFVVEQAWIEPVCVGFLAAATWALHAGRGRTAGVLLGLLAGIKQHMPLAAGLTLLFLWLRGERRLAARAGLYSLGSFVLGLAPLALADPRAFWQQTVVTYFERGLRLDSLSMPAWLANEAGIILGNGPLALLALASIAAGCLFLLVKHRAGWHVWAGALAVVYSGLFYFGKQAFCNYYYLLSFLFLLVVVFQTVNSLSIPENQ